MEEGGERGKVVLTRSLDNCAHYFNNSTVVKDAETLKGLGRKMLPGPQPGKGPVPMLRN